MSRKLPLFSGDDEIETFLDQPDLSDFITAERLAPTSFEFAAKEKTVSMRMPEALLDAVKTAAQRQGMPYQRFIRQILEKEISRTSRRPARRKTG